VTVSSEVSKARRDTRLLAESVADSNGERDSVKQNYGGGCATGRGSGYGRETKRRWAGCTQEGNPLPFVTAIVASNPGDSG